MDDRTITFGSDATDALDTLLRVIADTGLFVRITTKSGREFDFEFDGVVELLDHKTFFSGTINPLGYDSHGGMVALGDIQDVAIY